MKKSIPTGNFAFFKGICMLPLIILAALNAFGQHEKLQTNPPVYSLGRYFDTVFDRFGNKYTPDQLAITAGSTRHSAHGTPAAPASVLYTGCTPGYFRIYLEDSCGMDHYATNATELARLRVLCQVLTDISNLIQSPCTTTGQTVNIWVRAGLTTGLGVATPFFNVPYSTSKSGIVDNTAWLTINSGADAFAGIAFPLSTSGGGSSGSGGPGSTYYHASIAFNFTSSVTWHTDLSTAPSAGSCDLYTTALHEMMHALGFCSLFKYDGTSLFGTFWQQFSRYDMQLVNNAGTDHLLKTTSGCDLYQAAFNTAAGFSPPTSILSPGGCGSFFGGGETNVTVCSTAVKYSGGWPVNIPVYTPQCFEPGGSLSHFEDECYVPSYFVLGAVPGTVTNDQYFLLSNSAPNLALGGYSATTNPGVMKRYPTPEERQVLCDIGYKVNTTFGVPGVAGTYPLPSGPNLNYYDYGGAVCPGRQVVGFNDGTLAGAYTFVTSSSVPIDINAGGSGTSILNNDRVNGVLMTPATGGTFTCLEVMTGTGSVSASSGTFGTTVTYTPGSTDVGVQLLRYIPVNTAGQEGNITYIYVFVGDANCLPTTCDLVSNGDFENVTAGSYGYFLPNEHCWLTVNYVPMLLSTDAPTSPDNWMIPNNYYFQAGIPHPLSPATNHHFVSLYTAYHDATSWGCGSIHERLSSDLINGQQYQISFWGLIGGGATDGCCFTNRPTHLQFSVGTTFPLSGSSWIPTGYLPTGFNVLGEFLVYTDSFPDYTWHHYSYTVTYTGPTGADVLFIQAAPWDDVGPALLTGFDSAKSVGIDDLSIVPISSACPFSIPGPLSSCSLPFGLDTAVSVCVPGGTFSWPTLPVVGGAATVTTSNTFNPSNAYAASVATGGGGMVSVVYTYTVSGCVRTVATDVLILPSTAPLPPITGVFTTCAGATATLSNSLIGGVWSSTDLAVAVVDPATGVVTGIAPGIDTILYSLVGCSSTFTTVTIDPAPAAVTGALILCPGITTTLSDATAGGKWKSSDPSIATIDSVTGVVTAVAVGTATISYTAGSGCFTTSLVSVNVMSATISGPTIVNTGSTITLTDTYPGGTWSSSNIAIATAGSSSGSVKGIAVGTVVITYMLPSGCKDTIHVTVKPQTGIGGQTPDDASLSVIPNPNRGTLTLRGSLPSEYNTTEVTIEITDVLGKIIYNDVANVDQGMISKTISLDNSVSNGVYMIRLVNSSVNRVLRFTVQR